MRALVKIHSLTLHHGCLPTADATILLKTDEGDLPNDYESFIKGAWELKPVEGKP